MQGLRTFCVTHKDILIRVGIAFAIFLAIVTAFGMLADEVHEGDTLRVDQSILYSINSFSAPVLDSFFVGITQFGSVAFVAAVTIILALYLLWKKKYLRTFLLAASMIGAGVLTVTLKLFFERARPELWERLVNESNFSFPSGHAMASSALVLTIVALVWNTRWRFLAMIFGGIYVLAIGLSRLYLGVHYPTDILGGWLVSAAWVIVVSIIVYSHNYRRLLTRNKSS